MTSIAASATASTKPVTQEPASLQTLLENVRAKNASPEIAEIKADGPATNVTISPEAKAKYERLENDRAVADKLTQLLSTGSNSETKGGGKIGETGTTFEDLTGAADKSLGAINEIASKGFSKLDDFLQPGSKSLSLGTTDEEMLETLATASLAIKHNALKAGGKTEQAQQLRDAAVSGKLQFEDASKVEGLNASYQKVSNQSENGNTFHYDLDTNPTGDVKEALDNGSAFTSIQGDYGAFYVTIKE